MDFWWTYRDGLWTCSFTNLFFSFSYDHFLSFSTIRSRFLWTLLSGWNATAQVKNHSFTNLFFFFFFFFTSQRFAMCRHISLIINLLGFLSVGGYSGILRLWHKVIGRFIFIIVEIQRTLQPVFHLGWAYVMGM